MAFALADQFLIFGHGEWDVSDGSHTLDVVKNLWPSEAKLSNRFKNETPSSCAGWRFDLGRILLLCQSQRCLRAIAIPTAYLIRTGYIRRR